MEINEKAEQYKFLKRSKKNLEKRLEELRRELLGYIASNYVSVSGLTVQQRDLTTYDEDEVWEVMHEEAIHPDLFTKQVVDTSKIEELYLCGMLTDSHLRRIRKPQWSYALVEVGDERVQEIDAGSG